MKIIILAAGLGTRLDRAPLPKTLTTLDSGQSILELQIDNIANYHGVSDVIVVVGFEKERIKEAFPQLTYVESHNFAKENTAKSLLLALKQISNEDVLWINGDVVFHQKVLEPLFAQRRNSMVVDVAVVSDEEVKYYADDLGHILEVSKNIVHEPMGEALGINYFTAGDLPVLIEGLTQCAPQDYFEKGIEYCLGRGVEVWDVEVPPWMCVEVDFPEDLDRANEAMRSWKMRGEDRAAD